MNSLMRGVAVKQSMSSATEVGKHYDTEFFDRRRTTAEVSAAAVVPLVMELARPRSVIDVGCGEGTWLASFAAHGVERVIGLDGDYVDPNRLVIPTDCFIPVDLSRPFRHPEVFSLVVSLEVAEHLPESSADEFVESLTRLGDIVLFSAAIPGQGGTGHLNEQWPDYWVSRFRRHGFLAVDALRPQIRRDSTVAWWYRQNLLFFVSDSKLDDFELLRTSLEATRPDQLAVVHPELFESLRPGLSAPPWAPGVRQLIHAFPGALRRMIRKRLGIARGDNW